MGKIALETRVLLTRVVVVAVLACVGMAFGKYSGGLGTEAEPYQIGTVADWQELMATDLDWDKHFILITGLDMNGDAITPVLPPVLTSLHCRRPQVPLKSVPVPSARCRALRLGEARQQACHI